MIEGSRMTTEPAEDLMTQAEAARLRGVTRSAIAYLIAQGRLRTYERFGVTFVSRREVEEYVPQKPGPRPSAGSKKASKKTTRKGSRK
jgi:lysine/ornithine N-monooxygenase